MQIKPLIFGVGFVLVGLCLAITGGLNAWRAFHPPPDLRQTTCVLLEKHINRGAGSHKIPGARGAGYYEAWANVSYQDGGVSHTVAGDLFLGNVNNQTPLEALNMMKIGRRYPLWVDDQNPGRVYLSPRVNESPWNFLIMPCGGVVFVLLGLGCAVDALPRRRTDLALGVDDYVLTESADGGVRFRLPRRSLPFVHLILACAFASPFLVIGIGGLVGLAHPDWMGVEIHATSPTAKFIGNIVVGLFFGTFALLGGNVVLAASVLNFGRAEILIDDLRIVAAQRLGPIIFRGIRTLNTLIRLNVDLPKDKRSTPTAGSETGVEADDERMALFAYFSDQDPLVLATPYPQAMLERLGRDVIRASRGHGSGREVIFGGPPPLKATPRRDDRSSPSPVQTVQIERTAGGSVVIRAKYPPEKIRQATIGAVAFAVLTLMFPIIAFFFFGRVHPPMRWAAAGLFSVLSLYGITLAAIGYRHVRVACTISADTSGITIDRCRGRREWRIFLPRERITNIRSGFASSRRGSSYCLIIATRPWYRLNTTLLGNLGGEHLDPIANALRAAVDPP
jgi:hypothetical protein